MALCRSRQIPSNQPECMPVLLGAAHRLPTMPYTALTTPRPLPHILMRCAVRQGAFDAYAMGNYPYATSYISGDPDHPLPAWPMRAACNRMAGTRMKPSTLIEVRACAVETWHGHVVACAVARHAS